MVEGRLGERPSTNQFGYQQPLLGAQVLSQRREDRHDSHASHASHAGHAKEKHETATDSFMVADSPRCWKCSNADPRRYRTLLQGAEHQGLIAMTSREASSRRAS